MENENKTLTKKIDLKSFIVLTKLENVDQNQERGNSDFQTNDSVYLDSCFEVENLSKDERIVYPTDYAVMNKGWMSCENHGLLKKKSCQVWLRSADYNVGDDCYRDIDAYVCFIDFDGSFDNKKVEWAMLAICPALRLDLFAVVSARSSSQDTFKINAVANKNGRVLYHTIEFGEYPKSYVGEMKNKELEKLFSENKLVKTSKSYTGRYIRDNGKFELYSEFEHEGQKYVRVITKKIDNDVRFSDGTMAPESGTPLWVKVEPITWKIKNWEEMPRSINPKGNGSADFIDVRTEYGITSGIPFYTNFFDKYRSLWQNSVIRAQLNGYNTHQEIANGNGNSKYIAEKNYDFTKNKSRQMDCTCMVSRLV